ncbi:MAG TPA: 2-phospho-L-lactate guanylyltransferase [Roseiflexaceae bacterium]|nr:2-phospho-L-lactate guanylyltransferase [Roseiflexaceae bacterium]
MLYAIVPVKPLQLAKGRLSAVLTAPERRTLVLAMLGDVLAALHATEVLRETVVVSSDAEVLALAARLGAAALFEQAQGLNTAYAQAAAFAGLSGATALLALPADLPLVTSHEIAGLVAAGKDVGMALAPSRDGGTNGLYRSVEAVLPFLFGSGSLARHIGAARSSGLEPRLFRAPGLELDIDQPDDLLLLAEAAGETAAQQVVRELCVDARLACV